MKARFFSPIIAILLVLWAFFPMQGSVRAENGKAQTTSTGGVILYTVPPRTVCVGDTFTVEGGAFVNMPEIPPTTPGGVALAPLTVIHIALTAVQGSVSPNDIIISSNEGYFSFTYTAKTAGDEIIRATENDGLAFDTIQFKVESSCAYDVFLVTVLDFTVQAGDFEMHTLTDVTGTGTMSRVRSTSNALQGTGTWHLEENILSQPPECVQWYMPPLLVSGPFDLDGEMNSEDDTVSVILAFQPRTGPPVYHGLSVCVDSNGNESEGWGYIESGGDESLAAKIQTDFPIEGGSQQVELTGAGVNIVESAGTLIYTANLTIIPK